MRGELRCEAVSLGGNIPKLKKLRPGIAVAQSPGHILVCLQQKRRQWHKVTSELNGVCTLLGNDFREKAFINLTDIVESELKKRIQRRKRSGGDVDGFGHIESTVATLCHNPKACEDPTDGSFLFGGNGNNNNNNNNNNDMEEEEEEDDSDLRTEIAIVLDGSGSIDPEDFKQAKDFIYNMMKTFYEKCFGCASLWFIRHNIDGGFDLRESRRLVEVQAVTQVWQETWTASAIQQSWLLCP
ncbi:integrin alpha-E-like [Sceloporus undulatus]|uniref:integrin alpha-E-like n=1 Tax=Sceloporus undulatus TaxID=8520 RepID=UPI001C4D974B|nr:integrin alpha-E-like [Sceloporus undulatus]